MSKVVSAQLSPIRITSKVSRQVLLFIGCLCFAACGDQAGQTDQAPNLVLILADDLGYADVGFNGCEDIPTPNIDRIAKEGVIFSNGYVTWAACGPSRAGMITGRYQDRFGFSRNPLFAPNDPNMGLPLSEQTLAEALQSAHYKSVAIGKWHLGAHPTQRPLERGFTDFFGFLTGGHRYFPEDWTLADEYEVASQYQAYRTKLLRNENRIEEEEYLTDALSREAAQYIDKYQEDPFFIYLAYNAPHAPLQASSKYLERFEHIENRKRKIYAAMVSSIDDGVGRVLDQLDSLGLSDNTLVVFLSDNGGPERVNASDNGPLRGQKGDLFEGGIRVPFAMRWTGKISAGTQYDQPISALDIFATIVAQNSGQVKLKHSIDGVNLLPYLSGEKTGVPHDQLFWRRHDQGKLAMRQGDLKFQTRDTSSFLFNLKNDLGEETDLVGQEPEKAQELRLAQEQWNSQMMDPVFMGLAFDSIYNVLHPDRFTRPESQ
ncbi:MAG: sulfatase-like hydrolase/transferase [Saprospiraceae bacterium]|nr:sulfatase-like hydrolase/transferase [Saprospiraceae bacterium]